MAGSRCKIWQATTVKSPCSHTQFCAGLAFAGVVPDSVSGHRITKQSFKSALQIGP